MAVASGPAGPTLGPDQFSRSLSRLRMRRRYITGNIRDGVPAPAAISGGSEEEVYICTGQHMQASDTIINFINCIYLLLYCSLRFWFKALRHGPPTRVIISRYQITFDYSATACAKSTINLRAYRVPACTCTIVNSERCAFIMIQPGPGYINYSHFWSRDTEESSGEIPVTNRNT